MQVSIIIPALNEASEIGPCIKSAREAGGQHVAEIIVADGGSHDRTVEIAHAAADHVLSAPAGRAAQQNAAAARATGDILLFVHADNRLSPDCVSQIAAAADQYGQNICGGFHQCINDDDWKYRWLERGNAARVRRMGWVYGDQALFVTRDWFHSVGGFPDWPIMEDVELMRRLMKSTRLDDSRSCCKVPST